MRSWCWEMVCWRSRYLQYTVRINMKLNTREHYEFVDQFERLLCRESVEQANESKSVVRSSALIDLGQILVCQRCSFRQLLSRVASVVGHAFRLWMSMRNRLS
jgi:hypothetical protein